MENQPGQPSQPYSQYSPSTDPYAPPPPPYPNAAPAGQPGYPPAGQAGYPPTYPAAGPNQPTYPAAGQAGYPSTTQPPYGQAYPYGQVPGQPPAPAPYQPQQAYPYGSPPVQPRQTKNRLWLVIVAAVLIVVVFGLVLAVVNSNKNTATTGATPTVGSQASGSTATAAPTQTQASQQPTPTTAPTQASSSTGVHKVGEAVSIDNWVVTVNGVKISKGGQYDTLDHAGDVFLEIDVTVVNNTGQAQTWSTLLNFTLKDNTGQAYNQTFVSDAPASPDGKVTNGGKLRGTVAYEVPSTMHTFEFDVTPDSFNNNDVAVWSLSA